MNVAAIRLGAWIVPVCLLAPVASAQTPPGGATSPQAAQYAQLRSQISILEAVLERSVQEGVAKALGEISKTLEKMPGFVRLDVPIWTGRARGFHVDGYGVFFDVDVPDLPLNTTWTVQMATANDAFVRGELSRMGDAIAAIADPRQRVALQTALARLQRAVGADTAVADATAPSGVAATRVSNATQAPARAPQAEDALIPMPAKTQGGLESEIRTIYRSSISEVLIDTMLDQGRLLQLGPDERLTVGARVDRSGLAASKDPTVLLTIRGRDLSALYASRISREEAKKLVEVVWK